MLAILPRLRDLAVGPTVTAILAVAPAPTAAARSGAVATYRSWIASAQHVDVLDPHAPGVHSRLTVWFADRTSRVGGVTTTHTVIRVAADGYELNGTGGMLRSWHGAYLKAESPSSSSLGSVAPSLGSATTHSGPMQLVCDTASSPWGACPTTLPPVIDVSGTWTATGPLVPSVTQEVDDIGTRIWMFVAKRDARPTFQFSGGTLPVPAILESSSISRQEQISVGP